MVRAPRRHLNGRQTGNQRVEAAEEELGREGAGRAVGRAGRIHSPETITVATAAANL